MEKKRRRWPWVVALGLVVVLVGAAVALPLLLDVERYRGRIEAALTQATGWKAEIGQIGFSVWRGLVLTVSPVRLAAPGDASRLEVERLEIRAAVLPLLRGQLVIQSVDLVHPKIQLVRPTQAAGWVIPSGQASAGRAPAAQGSAPVDVSVGAVRITGGALVLEDRAGAPPWTVTLDDLAVSLAPSAGTVEGKGTLTPGGARLTFSGDLERGLGITIADLPTESLHPFLGAELIHAGGTLAGQAQLTLPPTIHGTIVGRSITLLAGEKPLDEMRAEFTVRNTGGGAWGLESLALDAGGLAVTGSGRLVPAVDLRFVLAETKLETALAVIPSILPLPLDLRPPGSVKADARVVESARGPLVTTATGELSAAQFVVSDLVPPAENVRAAFELDRNGALEVRILGGTIAGGPATGVARLASIDPPGKLTFDGELQDAAFGAMLGGFVDKAETITGPTGLKARVGLDLARPTLDARALSGRLDLDSRDVRFPGFDLERAVLAKLEEKLGPLAALAGLTGQGQEAAKPDDGRALLQSLTASVDFDRWPWGLERLTFAADDLSAAGAGTFDPEKGALALELTARLSPERTTRLVNKTKQLGRLVGPDGRLTLPLKVRGSLLSPSVEIDLGKALAGGESKQEAIQGLLEGLLERRNNKKKTPPPAPSP